MKEFYKNVLGPGVLAFLVFANGAKAQTPAKTTGQAPSKPAAAKPAALVVPQLKFEKYKLDNGLEVILSEDHRLPMVAVNMWDHVVPPNDLPGPTGITHLFTHLLFHASPPSPPRPPSHSL